MTHLELSIATAEWLVKRYMCRWAVAEPNVKINMEMPDVYGFKYYYDTTICEIKVSRSDFLKDKKKRVRLAESSPHFEGLGSLRYYVAPRGIIKVDEVRPLWGLVEYYNGKFYMLKKAEKFTNHSHEDETYFISETLAKIDRIRDRFFTNYDRRQRRDWY